MVRSALAAAALGLAISTSAIAQSDFPSKPIRVVVPFNAGSGADGSARVIAEQMQRTLGQSLLVENKPGASGSVAAVYVKNQPADGYTILVASNSPMSVNPVVMKNPGYDSVNDFKAVHGIGRSVNLWYVANESPYKTIADLIAAGKTKPLNIGSYSAGYQLGIAWLANMTGAQFSYVPYKGQAQVVNDVIGRQLDAGMGDLGGAIALIQTGKMRALAVSGDKRMPGLPNVPAIKETHPEYENYAWTSFYVRSETPPAVHAKLVDAMKKALNSKETLDYLEKQNSAPMLTFGPEEMGKYQREEITRFKRIAEAAGIKPE
jgi:tripartite-type tricarboxylate transporter receptor subunit TctC